VEGADTTRLHTGMANVLESAIVPKKFSGDPDEDAQEWISFMVRFIKFRDISNDNVKLLIPMFLTGAAAEWYENLAFPATLELFKTAFEEKFKATGASRWRARTELRERKQGATEKVSTYIETVRKMAKKMAIDDETALWSIIDGLRPEIKRSVIEKDPKTVAEMKTHAELAESANMAAGKSEVEKKMETLITAYGGMTITNVGSTGEGGSGDGSGANKSSEPNRKYAEDSKSGGRWQRGGNFRGRLYEQRRPSPEPRRDDSPQGRSSDRNTSRLKVRVSFQQS